MGRQCSPSNDNMVYHNSRHMGMVVGVAYRSSKGPQHLHDHIPCNKVLEAAAAAAAVVVAVVEAAAAAAAMVVAVVVVEVEV